MMGKWVSVLGVLAPLLATGTAAAHGRRARAVIVARPVVVARPAPVIVAQAAPVVVRPVIVGAPVYYPPPPVYYPPQPVAYRPPPPVVEYRDRPAPYSAPRREPSYMHNDQFGLNLYAQSGALGARGAPSTGLLGAGAALRYRPIPWIGLEGGIGVYTGRDFSYDTRNEVTGQGNIYGYINPESALQLYVFAGLNYTSARIGDGYGQTLTTNRYVGAQAGVGLELRFSRHFALNGDVRGLVRTRTDSDILFTPDTRTSGGAMGTIGMTVYF